MGSSVIVSTAQSATWQQWLGLAGLLMVAHVLYNLFLHPLSRFPGPLSARIGVPGLWAFYHTYKREFSWKLEELHDKYGPVVRFSPNHISFATPEAAQTLYAHGAGHAYPKTLFYSSIQVFKDKPTVFSVIDPDRHAEHRRAVSAAYSMNTLVKLEQYIEPLMDTFVSSLEVAAKRDENSVVDLAHWLHYFAMDAVGEIAFGKAFGYVERGSDPDRILVGVSNLSHFGSMAGWMPSISRSIKYILKHQAAEPGPEMVGKITMPLINKRFEVLEAAKAEKNGKPSKEAKEAAVLADRQDMLAKFIESKNPRTGQALTPVEVLRTAISVVGAGSDTTATALTAFLGYLVRHPHVYKDLQREIDEAFETGTLTYPVQYNQAVKLELLQACIKETLRVHPPIPMSLSRVVATGQGLVLRQGMDKYSRSKDGIVVPPGTEVSVAPYVLHRSKEAFGEDAREYNPRRWLDLDESTRREMERNNLAFGAGARQCIGKNISLMEINKILPTILRVFDFSLPKDRTQKTWRDSDGKVGHGTPWNVGATWFLEVKTLPMIVKRRPDIELQ